MRARKSGVPLSFVPAAVVYHHFHTSWAGLFRQFRRYGAYEPLVCSKHPEYLHWLWSSSEIPSTPLAGQVSARPQDAALLGDEADPDS